MIDPSRAVFFIPGHLKKFKLDLFNRVGGTIEKAGGRVVHADFAAMGQLKKDEVPIVGCTPELRVHIDQWIDEKKEWCYWDRGYFRRVFATWLPPGKDGGYYRWVMNNFQLQNLRERPSDRWQHLNLQLKPWSKNGRHIVLAAPSETYSRFHKLENWSERMLDALSRLTDRVVIARHKESKRPLQEDLVGAHALVTHGSITAVEAAFLGCPVFVDRSSAAALVGLIDLERIEKPVYPDREVWVKSLAYGQFNERELVDGTLWKLLS